MAEVTYLRNNALPYPIYGAPFTVVFPIVDNTGSPVAGAAGLDSEISKNGDTIADCTNEATQIATSSGLYYLSLTGTELTCDVAAIRVQTSTTDAKTTDITLYPRKLVTIRSGTAASAGSITSTIILDSGASAVDDFYNGMVCIATIDTNVEVRVISDYVGSTKTASVVPDWNVAPDSDDTFVIKLTEGPQIMGATVQAWLGTAVTAATAGVPDTNAARLGNTAQTGRDIGASVLLSSGTGTGQLDFTSGVVKSSMVQILGSVITGTAANIVGAFTKFFDKTAPTGTVNSLPDAVPGATGGVFIAGTNAATAITTGLTTTFTGNLSGNVTGSVGSVTGNVAGSVASVTNAVTVSSGTGAGQLDITSGVVKSNLAQILGTALTETSGLIAAAFKKFFNVATPTGTVNSLPDAVPGAANGVFIAGTNAATAITTGLTTTFTGNLSGSVGSIASGGIAAASIATGAITNVKFAAGAIDASAIAADAIGASELAADAVTEIANGVWALDATGQQVQGTFGQAIGDPGATAKSIWGVANAIPDSGALTTLQADTDNIQTRLPTSLVSGRMDSSVGAMATDTMNAAALATDAVTEIVNAIVAVAGADPAGVPAANAAWPSKIDWICAKLRNKETFDRSSGVNLLRNDGDTSTIGTFTATDDGTTFVRPKAT